MKIFDATNTYERQAQVNDASENEKTREANKKERADRPEPEAAATPSEDVVVSLSETSREMQLAEEAVAEAKDVREEMVDAVKQAYQSGQYQVDPDQIANKMVGTIISEQV